MTRLRHTRYPEVTPYRTKDGSEIRELMHPAVQGNTEQSLAEATLPVGGKTLLHLHYRSEELYHVSSGEGWLQLGGDRIAIGPGDTICIAPGTAHRLENSGTEPLRVLCCCSPPYSHGDTELLE
nr:cupin domain-containing protein [Thiohalomonas denitrificans]